VIFTLDGTKLVATAGNEILMYDSATGQVIKSLKGHKENVICLCPLIGDGFASGMADKQVIIWSGVLQGTLKYSHGGTIQSFSQNPFTGSVLSLLHPILGFGHRKSKQFQKPK
jgi:intraflagellar transport protein 122